jgi:RNA polymerase sigma-70 factor (ECF subfamily)
MDGIDVSHSAGMPCSAADDTDQALATAVASGDRQAWERFFDVYGDWAYRFSYSHLGGNRADAEDLCSDIMMTAACSIKRFDHRQGTLDQWLLGLARHRLAGLCRERRLALPVVPELAASNPGTDEVVGNVPTDESLIRDLVGRALSSLPARQAAVLIGKYVSGYTVDELARETRSSSKAVESLLSRARAGFRAAFRRLAGSGSGGESHE